MSHEVTRFLVISGILTLLNLAAYVVASTQDTPASRHKAAEKWARRHQVSLDEEWSGQLERQLPQYVAIEWAGSALFCGVVCQAPSSLVPVTASVAVLPFLVGVVHIFVFTREPLSNGPRVARLRELTTADYLPPRTRWLMWAAASAGAIVTWASAFTRSEPWLGVAALMLPAGAMCVELVAGRLSRLPEPARDAAHLYAQDAFRADLIRCAAWRTGYAAAFVCLMSADIDRFSDVALVLSFGAAVAAGALVVADVTAWFGQPDAYMRSRLWPTLKPGQVLCPDDQVPIAGVSA